jgi:hypothetical protein
MAGELSVREDLDERHHEDRSSPGAAMRPLRASDVAEDGSEVLAGPW